MDEGREGRRVGDGFKELEVSRVNFEIEWMREVFRVDDGVFKGVAGGDVHAASGKGL